jgi:hypothetical protein
MNNKRTKLLALLLAAAIVFSLAACGKEEGETTTTAEQTTAQETTAEQTTAVEVRLTEAEIRLALGEAQAAWDGTTANLTDEMKAAVSMYYKTSGKPVQIKDDGFYFVEDEGATVSDETTAVGGTTATGETTAAAGTVPSTKAEMLAAYTAVMNRAKTVKPGFTKYEYQALPGDKINIIDGGNILSFALDLAGRFMTTEEKAKKEPGVNAKGGDMNDFPVKYAPKGCMITDPGAIKRAKCDVLPNGNYQLTLVLVDEMNPEHYQSGSTSPSITGGMFTPLSPSDFEQQLNSGIIKATIGNLTYSMKYFDSTSVLTYNPATSQIVSLNQVTYTVMDISGRIKPLFTDAAATAVLEMHYKYFDFEY